MSGFWRIPDLRLCTVNSDISLVIVDFNEEKKTEYTCSRMFKLTLPLLPPPL